MAEATALAAPESGAGGSGALRALARAIVPVLLIAAVAAALAGVPARLPIQAASWLAFIAVLIAPGYLLTEIVAWQCEFDLLERLALAFPLGVLAMTAPGLVALLAHLTIDELRIGWMVMVAALVLVWSVLAWRRRASLPRSEPWHLDELVLLLVVLAGLVAAVPALIVYKMDGDAYGMMPFTADALAGLPLNAREPLFGTDYGPGVRMAFNQLLPVFYLWTRMSGADPVQLIAVASRTMLALWALLNSYMLGRAVGQGSRRLGLLCAFIQLAVFLTAPFFRDDSASIFFFERINADKFTVSVAMLPAAVSVAIAYVRRPRREAWVTAALAALAVSSVHALIAAMLALAMAGMAVAHVLVHLQDGAAWRRATALAAVVAAAMLFPLIQLVLNRQSPMAATYPSSFDGWPVGDRMAAVLPNLYVKSVDLYGPQPDLGTLSASDVNTAANPFLIWRFAANLGRRRLVFLSVDRYVSDPSLVLEPPYLLALLALPVLCFRLRSHVGVQYVVGTYVAVLFVLFNPIVTPLIGRLVVPWLLWRIVWLIPYAPILALAIDTLARAVEYPLLRWGRYLAARGVLRSLALLALVLSGAFALSGRARYMIDEFARRPAGPTTYPTPLRLFAVLGDELDRSGAAVVLADANMSITLPAFVADAHVVARDVLTSEVFPADAQEEALQRHIDQYRFFESPLLTPDAVDILQRNHVGYVVTESGSDIDLQLRLWPDAFRPLVDDGAYSLYAVEDLASVSPAVDGNQAATEQDWDGALEAYRIALSQDPADPLARVGLAQAYGSMGRFDLAAHTLLAVAEESGSATLHYYAGRMCEQAGDWACATTQLSLAASSGESVPRFHLALGNACLRVGDNECADVEFAAAIDIASTPEPAWKDIALATIWEEYGDSDRALAALLRAEATGPTAATRLVLASSYARLRLFDRSRAVLGTVRRERPFSTDAMLSYARLQGLEGDTEGAVATYRSAVETQGWLMQDSVAAYTDMALALSEAGRYEDATAAAEAALSLRPYSASALTNLGAIYSRRGMAEEAIEAYRQALEVNPGDALTYLALVQEYQLAGRVPDDVMELLGAAGQFGGPGPYASAINLYLGDIHGRAGNAEAAIAAYVAVGDAQSSGIGPLTVSIEGGEALRARAYSRLAATYDDLGQPAVAASYYRAATAAGGEARAYVALGDYLRRQGDFDGAEAAYGEAIRGAPTNPAGYWRLSDLLRARGDEVAARAMVAEGIAAAVTITEAEEQAGSSSRGWAARGEGSQGAPRGSSDDGGAGDAARVLTGDALAELDLLDDGGSAEMVSALAQLYRDLGEPGAAAELYKQAIEAGLSGDGSPRVLAQYYAGLGAAYRALGQLDEARAAYEESATLDRWSVAGHLGLANVLSAQGMSDEALAEYSVARQVAPGSVDAALAFAAALDAGGDDAEALEVYLDVVEQHPGSMEAHIALGRAHEARRDWAVAEASYREAVACAPGAPEPYLALARLLFRRASYEECRGVLEKATSLDRANSDAYLELGSVSYHAADYSTAAGAYEAALGIDPDDWRARAGMAAVERALGHPDAAIRHLELAVAVEPLPEAPVLSLSGLYRQQGMAAEAEETLIAALRRSPESLALRLALADLYRARGQTDLEARELLLALGEHAGSCEALLAYAEHLRSRGKVSQAASYEARAEAVAGASAASSRVMARYWADRGRDQRALHWARRAVSADGADVESLLLEAELLADCGYGQTAIVVLREATDVAPGDGEAWRALGVAYQRQGSLSEAIAALGQAIAVQPSHVPSYGDLAQALLAADRVDEAAALLDEARRANPGSYLVDVYLADALARQLDYGGAALALNDAIVAAPGVAELYLDLGGVLERQASYEGAAAAYRRAVSANAGDARGYAGAARCQDLAGRTEEAVSTLSLALSALPAETSLAISLSAIYARQNQTDLATGVLRRAVDAAPGDESARTALASLYQSLGSPLLAEAQLRLAVARNPFSAAAYVALAAQVLVSGRAEEAARLYGLAEPMAYGSADESRAVAMAWRDRRRLDRALLWTDRAISYAPGDLQNWVSRSGILAQQEEWEGAIDSARYATTLDPTDASAWLVLGEAMQGAGRVEDAIVAFARAVSCDATFARAYQALATAYLEVGDEWSAERTVLAARRQMPGSYVPSLYAAEYLESTRRWDDAMEVLRQATAAAPGETAPLLALSDIVRQYQGPDEAAALAEQAVSLRPGEQAAGLALTDLLLGVGRAQEALQSARDSLAARPGDAELLLRLGQALRATGDYAEAQLVLDQVTQLLPGGQAAYVELASVYVARHETERAIAAYEGAIAAAPGEAGVYLGLSRLLEASASPEEALATIRRGIAAATSPATLYVELADFHLRHNRTELAMAALIEGAEALGEASELLIATGRYYESRGDFGQAELSYRSAVEAYPEDPAGYVALGAYYIGRGQPRQAQAQHEVAVALDPESVTAQLALARSLQILGRSGDAEAALETAIRLAPTEESGYAGLAGLYASLGRRGDAAGALERGLSAIPTSSALLVGYSDLMLDGGDRRQALALADRAVAVAGDAAAYLARAALLLRLGRTSEAAADLGAAVSIEPGNAETFVALGDYYAARGDASAARQAYRQGVAAAPGVAAGYLGLARLDLLQGHTEAAWANLRLAREAQPALGDVPLEMARASASWGQLGDAASLYRQAMQLAPLDPRAYTELMPVLYASTGDVQSSLDPLARAEATGLREAAVYVAVAELYTRDGQSGVAGGWLSRAIEVDPRSADGYVALAQLYLAEGLRGDAETAAAKAAALAPADQAPQIALGHVALARGDTALAEQRYLAAAALDATRPAAYLALAGFYLRQGRQAEAADAGNKAMDTAPLDWQLVLETGDVYAGAGAAAMALSAYERAASMSGGRPEPLLRQVDVYLSTGSPREAAAVLDRAVAVDSDGPDVLLRLARLSEQRGDLAAAEGCARRLIAVDSTNAAGYMALADALLGQQRLDEAAASYRRSLELDPHQPAAYDRWVRTQLDVRTEPFTVDTGRLAQALASIAAEPEALHTRLLMAAGQAQIDPASPQIVSELSRALAIDPAYADIHRLLALAYEARLDGRAATASWWRYLGAAVLDADTREATEHLAWLRQVSIESPANGDSVSGALAISGAAAREPFAFYKLEYLAPGAESWAIIGAPVSERVSGGLLGVWSTQGMPAGAYRLRLTVVDQTGNYGPFYEVELSLTGAE